MVPVAADPNGSHNVITTALAAMVLGKDQKVLEVRAAEPNRCFIHLSWSYEARYPKFTTMHHLVIGSSPIMALQEGPAWAEKIAEVATSGETLGITSTTSHQQWNPGWTAVQPHPTLISKHLNWEIDPWSPPSSPQLPGGHGTTTPVSQDDQLSVCSDLASTATTVSEPTTPNLFLADPLERAWSSPFDTDINGGWMTSGMQHQFQDDAFQQQKREANDLYCKTGDVTGLIAVMRTANRFSHSFNSIFEISDFDGLPSQTADLTLSD